MSNSYLKQYLIIVFACSLAILQGCAGQPGRLGDTQQVYGNLSTDSLPGSFAPLIAMQAPDKIYNRIGHAAARLNPRGEEDIYITNHDPAFYTRQQPFTGKSSIQYLNLIYRMHFPYVPQPHLTAGRNGGLLIIITLNQQQQPLLITTVHTCGCYLAMIPTSYLAPDAYPPDWNIKSQSVYGEQLPGRLDYPADNNTNLRPLITLRSGAHRVMNIQLSHANQAMTHVNLLPAESLERLALDNTYTSFFNETGPLKGYVKGAFKPWEFLLMSWWNFDLNIGRDKQLGDPANTGTVFYTSLKPWARDKSNLWFFADFLDYWGWRF